MNDPKGTDPNTHPADYNPSGCWPKSPIDAVEAEAEKNEKAAPELPKYPVMPPITFDDFMKVDIRSGRVLVASRVPKSDKLLQLQVDFGHEGGLRQILAGIGLSFEPEALVNNCYLFVVNLAPRKMMGLESHGMMLAAGGASGQLSLTQTSIPMGMRVG